MTSLITHLPRYLIVDSDPAAGGIETAPHPASLSGAVLFKRLSVAVGRVSSRRCLKLWLRVIPAQLLFRSARTNSGIHKNKESPE